MTRAMSRELLRLFPFVLFLASACQPDATPTDGGGGGTDAPIAPGTDAPIAPGTDAPIAPGTDAPAIPTGPTLVSLAAGHYVTCGVLDDGTARCWGDNREGQLGDGTTTSSVTPVEVSGLTDATAIATGYEFSCALRSGGTVVCWGSGSNGRLGNGASDDSLVPVPVTGLTNIVEIGAGQSTACALEDDGTVWCWGRGGDHGTTSFADTNVPVEVPGLTGVAHLSTASHGGTSYSSRTCGVRDDGTAFCWGFNDDGQNGVGDQSLVRTPADMMGVDDATAITAAMTHTCVVRADGTYCAGSGSMIGDGSVDRRFVATEVMTSVTFESLASGWEHTCGLTSGGDVWCWGRNGSGQIGDGEEITIGDQRLVPSQADVTNVVLLAAGMSHTCAHTESGVTYCWGRNEYGERGSGTPSSLDRTNVPTPVVW